MEEYTFLRQLADSWGLLAMFLAFVGIIIWAFRPGSRSGHDDAANIPLRHNDKPAPPRGEISASLRGDDRPAGIQGGEGR